MFYRGFIVPFKKIGKLIHNFKYKKLRNKIKRELELSRPKIKNKNKSFFVIVSSIMVFGFLTIIISSYAILSVQPKIFHNPRAFNMNESGSFFVRVIDDFIDIPIQKIIWQLQLRHSKYQMYLIFYKDGKFKAIREQIGNSICNRTKRKVKNITEILGQYKANRFGDFYTKIKYIRTISICIKNGVILKEKKEANFSNDFIKNEFTQISLDTFKRTYGYNTLVTLFLESKLIHMKNVIIFNIGSNFKFPFFVCRGRVENLKIRSIEQ